VPGIREVTIWLCSQIGKPIDRPMMAAAQLILQAGANLEDVRKPVAGVIDRELAGIHAFSQRLAQGELAVW
jgi:S-adenosylmethionine synthetase